MNSSTSNKSKIVMVSILVLIVAAVIAWTLFNLRSLQGFDPEVAHEFSSQFQHECRRDVQDRETCKKIHGLNHRRCFEAQLRREDPDDPTSAFVYNRPEYLSCMREAMASEIHN